MLGRSGGRRGHAIGVDQGSRKPGGDSPSLAKARRVEELLTASFAPGTRKPWKRNLSGCLGGREVVPEWQGAGGQSSQVRTLASGSKSIILFLPCPSPRVLLDPDKHLTPNLFS